MNDSVQAFIMITRRFIPDEAKFCRFVAALEEEMPEGQIDEFLLALREVVENAIPKDESLEAGDAVDVRTN